MAFGNWDVIYKNGVKGGEDRTGWAILSIKEEIVYNGIAQGGLTMTTPAYGIGTAKKVQVFQRAHNLVDDGEVGPKTAHELYKKRTLATEKKYDIETNLLCKLKKLESSDFPSCISVDLHDRGQLQINSIAHADVTDKQAFNFPFAIDWAGRHLHWLYTIFHNWDDALAAYNVGEGGARTWIRNGRPSDATAAVYIRVVRKQVC